MVLFGCLGGGWEGEESEIGGCCGDEWELHTMLPRRDCFVQETVAWIRAGSPLWRACMCANACVHHSGKDAAWNHSWGIMWWIFSVATVLLSLDFCYMTSFYPSSTVDHLHYVGGVAFVCQRRRSSPSVPPTCSFPPSSLACAFSVCGLFVRSQVVQLLWVGANLGTFSFLCVTFSHSCIGAANSHAGLM